MKLKLLLILASSVLLSACATGPRVVDSLVTTQAAHAPGTALLQNARYRFVEAPSLVGQPPQAQIQAMAAQALLRVGAVQDDADARVSVQAEGQVSVVWVPDYYGGWSNPQIALGLGYGGGWRGGGFGLGFDWPYAYPYGYPSRPVYVSEVSLVMRDLKTGQIIYDTRARHQGLRGDVIPVLSALFVAALQGYPNPGPAVRRVDVPLIPIEPAPAAAQPAPPAAPAPAAPNAPAAPAAATPMPVQPHTADPDSV